MQTHVSAQTIAYEGWQLRSGWITQTFGVTVDAIAAFIGPCHVPTEHLVDLDDREAGAIIEAAQMLHVIAEHASADIRVAVLRQRLLVCLVAEQLERFAPRCAPRRSGDDIYVNDRKLTVSIATTSPHSGLIHLGINVDPEGAPVPAIGLAELGIDARAFAGALLEAYAAEITSIQHAEGKVRMAP